MIVLYDEGGDDCGIRTPEGEWVVRIVVYGVCPGDNQMKCHVKRYEGKDKSTIVGSAKGKRTMVCRTWQKLVLFCERRRNRHDSDNHAESGDRERRGRRWCARSPKKN